VTRRTVVLVERRTREVRLHRADATVLRDRFRGVIEVNPGAGPGRYQLTPRGVVGTLDTPRTRLTIRPKLPWPNLRMLLGLDPSGFGAGGRHDPAADLLAVLAAEFAERLREVTAAGLVRGYREADHAAAYLRGRLRTADQLRDAASRAFPAVFHVTESVFDLDVPWNQIPKAVADTLLRHPALPPAVRAAVGAAAAVLDDVTPVLPTDELFGAAAREPRAGAYNALLALCRTLRDGLTAADGTPGGGAFLVDLGRAFERFLEVGLDRQLRARPSWSVEAQPGFAVGDLTLRPDVLVRRRGAARWVLDAKWKRPGPDPADLHQVLAYATVTGARRVGLVYPGTRFARRTLRAGPVAVALVRLPVAGPTTDLPAGLARLAAVVRGARP
jgi:5-methylcytosine-specific restriction enzyme subunit McrC